MSKKGLLLPMIVILIAFAFATSVAFAEEQTNQEKPDQKATDQEAAPADELKIVEAESAPQLKAAGSLAPLQEQALKRGPLPADPAALREAKARAEHNAKNLSSKASDVSLADVAVTDSSSEQSEQNPKAVVNDVEGLSDPSSGPSDSTGAAGSTRYIELVNSKFGIYDKSSSLISSGTLNQLSGASVFDNVFDPQIIWDPTQSHFFYLMDNIVSDTDNRLQFGFSKNESPSSSADWCKYTILYNDKFPDFPKLGDTTNHLLVGVNVFDVATNSFLGSDLDSVTKPPTGSISTCPDASTLTTGRQQNLSGAFTPVPANQIDASTTGYVVARDRSLPSSHLILYNVDENATTGTFNLTSSFLPVSTYDVPASAPQPGTPNLIDTSDARPTQAVSAIDPSQGTTAIWTQHTIFGGSGALVRWYEISPNASSPSLFQSEDVPGSSGLFVFNAAISPNRVSDGTTGSLGDSLAVVYNTSSTIQRPDIRTRSKVGSGATSSPTIEKSSLFSLDDFTCHDPDFPGLCRWGDYSGATPDPSPSSTDTNGKVWLTNQYVRTAGIDPGAKWGTRNFAENFAASPPPPPSPPPVVHHRHHHHGKHRHKHHRKHH